MSAKDVAVAVASDIRAAIRSGFAGGSEDAVRSLSSMLDSPIYVMRSKAHFTYEHLGHLVRIEVSVPKE